MSTTENSSTDRRLTRLREHVEALHANFTNSVAYHELWKPTAFDKDLHVRMGSSYASQALQVIRVALRREMLLALMRIWDQATGAQSIFFVAEELKKEEIWAALIDARMQIIPDYMDEAVKLQLQSERTTILSIFDAYCKGGDRHRIYKSLMMLRSESLAHTQKPTSTSIDENALDADIDAFYADTSAVVTKLMSAVVATSVDHLGTAGVYKHYARFFWINARGERTEGHPLYRPPRDAA